MQVLVNALHIWISKERQGLKRGALRSPRGPVQTEREIHMEVRGSRVKSRVWMLPRLAQELLGHW